MNKELIILCFTAASIGFLHTVFGPDHYLPFIVMARARKWPLAKTGLITIFCGIGHIMSSVTLGVIGIIFGIAVMRLEALESFRGNIAAWALIGFGLAYFIWGLRRAIRHKPHRHAHLHQDQKHDSHYHVHSGDHSHVHNEDKRNITPWILFTIFVLGPCEPLIPILMYPAAKKSITGLFLVTGIFGLTTIITMLSVVIITSLGVKLIPLGRLERYTHAIAGATICLSGLAIHFLNL